MEMSYGVLPKVVNRRTMFPGKENRSTSFNLTALGRQLLKEQSTSAGLSLGDYVESLVRERAGYEGVSLPENSKTTGPKGGAKSYFFGKNRGTTTGVATTAEGRRLLDEQVAASKMSRGDYIECLLRTKAGLLSEQVQNEQSGESFDCKEQSLFHVIE